MEPHAFVAEVYRRMSLRRGASPQPGLSLTEALSDSRCTLAAFEYQALLPANKNTAILDIGFGRGWFIAACLKLGYTNISGADFGIVNKSYVSDWSPDRITLHEIESDIGEFLSPRPEHYDFIHLSHVIEHVPKYSLLWVVDAIYRALKPGGWLVLRTPNMEGPTANSSFYVTLAHEYGFCGSNLTSLLEICGFDDIRFHHLASPRPSIKQRLGKLLRWPYLQESRFRHRLFGANEGRQFGAELIASARRGDAPPLFDPKFK